MDGDGELGDVLKLLEYREMILPVYGCSGDFDF